MAIIKYNILSCERCSLFKGTGVELDFVERVFHKSALAGFEENDILVATAAGVFYFSDTCRFYVTVAGLGIVVALALH